MPTSSKSSAQKRHPRTLIPILPGGDHESLLRLAKVLSETDPVLLVGIVPIDEGESLSTGAATARKLRQFMAEHCDRENIKSKPRIRVTYEPWNDIKAVVRREQKINLVLLDWEKGLPELRLSASDILRDPPCDVGVIKGPIPEKINEVLIPMRGGPHAERAVKLGLSLAKPSDSLVKALRLKPQGSIDGDSLAFTGMRKALEELPDVELETIETKDNAGEILTRSSNADIVVLGTAAHPKPSSSSFGEIPDLLFEESETATIAIKTQKSAPVEAKKSLYSSGAISVLVDRWFAENTFHCEEFSDLKRLETIKKERGLSVSVALPTLNESATIGAMLEILKKELMEKHQIIDELIVIDSNSSDNTREIVKSHDIPVYIHQEVLPEHGARPGKGEALWKSLHLTKGDIILWVDTDISNFCPRFIYGLLGPLLQQPNIKLTKGFYKRPLKSGAKLEAGKGGRVTELCARPLFNLCYPELSGIIQPLSGEYGGRRETLEQLPFTSGYGVETCIMIEMFSKFKLSSIAQIDMVERIHTNQPLASLSKMSFAIIQTFFDRLEKRYGRELLEDVNRTMKIIKHEPDRYYLDVEEIAELERPPMIEIPEYRAARGLEPLEAKNEPIQITANGPTITYPTRAN